MTINRDSVLFVGYALATAALTVCTAHGWVPAADAVEITGVLTAFATAYHIPNARAADALRKADEAVTPTPTVVATVTVPDAVAAGRAEPS